MTTKQIQAIRLIISTYFKNGKGEPFEPTDGQCEIFGAVVNKNLKYVWISAPTRYGKTEIMALAYIYLAVFHNLKIPVVGGSQDKANKIMEYIVQHLSDHPDLSRGLINVDISSIEKLKVSVSKTTLRWADGGWIFVTSVDVRNISKEGEGVVGEGGDVIGVEEAGLIRREEQFSKVVRMTEEDRDWGKMVMSGNCVENSVFEKAFNNPLFYKVRIDLEQAIAEGRFTRKSLDIKKTMTTTKDWKRYYLVLFPEAGEFAYFKPRKYQYLPGDLKYFGAIDPALGESKKGSRTGIIVLGVDEKGQKYEVDSIIKHLTPEESIRTIMNLPYEFNRFGFEDVMFQRYLKQHVDDLAKQSGKKIRPEGIKQAKKKEERIESLEPDINTGQILFKGDNQLWKDMQDYPETEFLDGLDALEMVNRIASKKPPRFSIGDDDF